MIRRSVTVAAVLLALFHGYLLVSQMWSGAFAEPGLVARWIVAAVLLRGLITSHRTHQSLIWGRKALCIWLLAALLHGPAMVRAGESSYELPSLPPVVLQIAATIGLGLSFTFAALAATQAATLTWRRAAADARSRARVSGFYPQFRLAPRPPPAFAHLL